MAFIASLGKSHGVQPSHHAVMGQTRVNKVTGEVYQVIVIHRHPIRSPLEFRERVLPKSFGGFPVEEHAWPDADL